MTRLTRGSALGAFLILSWMSGLAFTLLRDTRPAALLLGYLEHTGPGLLAAALLFAGAWGIGTPLRQKLLPDFGRTDPVSGGLIAIALGWVVLQCAAVSLGSFGWLGARVAQSLVAISLLACVLAVRHATGLRALFRVPRYPVATGLAWAGAGALLLPSLFAAGAPAMGPDELQYHQRFVEHLLRVGSFVANPEDPISGFAQGFHAQAALAYSIAGSAALRPLSMGFGILVIVCGERITRRTFGPGAALIYLPIMVGAASFLRFLPTLGTDLPLGFFVTVAALLVLDWSQAPHSAGLRPVALGLLGGAAVAIKFTAPLYLAPLYLALLLLLLRPGGGQRSTALPLLIAGSISALFSLPWLVKNFHHCGHPLYPLLGMNVPEAASAAFRFNFTENYGPGLGWTARLRTPWDLFILGREFDPRHFLGRLNGWPLLALPGTLVAVRHSRQARVLATLVLLGFLAWAQVLRRVTYLLPLWPAIAALAAGSLASLGARLSREQRRPLAVLLATVLVASASAEIASPYRDFLDDASVSSGQENPDAYVDKKLPGADALRWIKEHIDSSESVALFWTWHGWSLPHSLHWIGAEEFTPFRIAVHRAGSAKGLRDELKKRGIRWVLARRHRFVPSSYPFLSEDEFRIGFEQPVLRAEETLTRYGIRRFASGPFVVYEIP